MCFFQLPTLPTETIYGVGPPKVIIPYGYPVIRSYISNQGDEVGFTGLKSPVWPWGWGRAVLLRVDMLQPPELVGLFSSTGHHIPCNKTRTRNLAIHICLKHLINPVLLLGRQLWWKLVLLRFRWKTYGDFSTHSLFFGRRNHKTSLGT